MDLNLKSVIGIVITLEIAKRELIYGRIIYKNREGYKWNETYLVILENEKRAKNLRDVKKLLTLERGVSSGMLLSILNFGRYTLTSRCVPRRS